MSQGTVYSIDVISNNYPSIKWYTWFTTVPIKALSDKESILSNFFFSKLIIGGSIKKLFADFYFRNNGGIRRN